jgi:hypothetical protein
MKLWNFIKDNLAFAFYGNTGAEYSNEEYGRAKESLKPYLSKIQGLNEDLLNQSFACVIRHIKYVKNDYDKTWTAESMKAKGKKWSQYHTMIFEFNRVLQSFRYRFDGELESWGKTFPIQKVIFKGAKKKQSIELEGDILEILGGIFDSFNSLYSKTGEEMMRNFSRDFYEAYIEFQGQWNILNAEEGTLARQLIKNREESSPETAFNGYRNKTAFYIHSFIKRHDKSTKKIPEWHKKFIGDLFISCGIAHDEKAKRAGRDKEARIERGFIDTSNYNTVRRWIEEGERSLK